MWIFSFLVKPAPDAALTYYQITSIFQIIVFSCSALMIKKISGQKALMLFIFAPAVLYSLNRNWDIWAVITMLISIYFFDKKFYVSSALILGVSISTKFFPIVLLLPIAAKFASSKEYKNIVRYIVLTFISWFTINLPFMIIDFKGWLYFYKFSYEREIGSASVFEILRLVGLEIPYVKVFFYLFNISVLIFAVIFFKRYSRDLSLKEGAFLILFLFLLFNKQYSMQYIIWLTALAALALVSTAKFDQDKLIGAFVLWQFFELIFQYTFFQNVLTNYFANSAVLINPKITSVQFGVIGIIRYLTVCYFTYRLYSSLIKTKQIGKLHVCSEFI
jgi:uncharacterized membrane protein